jgi:hypothetical protein
MESLMPRRRLIALLACAALTGAPRLAIAQNPTASPATARKPAQLPADSMDLARRYIGWLLESRSDSLFAHLDSLSKKDLGSPAALDKMALEVAAQVGTHERSLEERWVTRNGRRQFWHTGKFSLMEEPVMARVVILPTGEIAGFGFNLAANPPPVDP